MNDGCGSVVPLLPPGVELPQLVVKQEAEGGTVVYAKCSGTVSAVKTFGVVKGMPRVTVGKGAGRKRAHREVESGNDGRVEVGWKEGRKMWGL